VAPVLTSVDLLRNKISLATSTPGAKVFYSIDGGAKQQYTAPIEFTKAMKLYTQATADGLVHSVSAMTEIAAPQKRVRVVLLSASSEMPNEGEAARLVDGNPDTYWHTNYGLTLAKYPHVLEFDLVDAGTLTGFTLLPRQDGNSNGRIKDYEFSVSSDRKSWKPVKSGTFPDNGNLQKVKFDQAVKARYVRFSAVSEQHGQDFASAAEIGFLSE